MSFEDKHGVEHESLRDSPTKSEKEVDLDKWQPGLDDIPITAQLTRANKEKLAKRDEEIAQQEEKLREIEEMIAKRKADRDAKAEELERLMSPAKPKKRGKKGAKGGPDRPAFYEEPNEDAAPESPYKAVLREAAKEEAAFYAKCDEEMEEASPEVRSASGSAHTVHSSQA